REYRQRPSGCASDQANKFAPSHPEPSAVETSWGTRNLARRDRSDHRPPPSGLVVGPACSLLQNVSFRRAPWKAALSSGCKTHPATAPAGSNRGSCGGNEMAEALG